jgi:hypothetical protein
MPVWRRPSAGAPAPLPYCIHALTCTHAPTRVYTSCPACSSAPLVVRLLHCQSRPSRASPRRLSHPCCCVTLQLILYAPENGRKSFEWALHQIFRRCACPVAEDGACGAGHCQPCPPSHACAECAFHSLIFRARTSQEAHLCPQTPKVSHAARAGRCAREAGWLDAALSHAPPRAWAPDVAVPRSLLSVAVRYSHSGGRAAKPVSCDALERDV